eukprot:9332280-Ditylum_brightwellii.AAC.1
MDHGLGKQCNLGLEFFQGVDWDLSGFLSEMNDRVHQPYIKHLGWYLVGVDVAVVIGLTMQTKHQCVVALTNMNKFLTAGLIRQLCLPLAQLRSKNITPNVWHGKQFQGS